MGPRRLLRCRLGRHAPIRVVAIQHRLHPYDLRGLKRPGSVVTYRCGRCGRRFDRASDAYFWRLEDVLKRR